MTESVPLRTDHRRRHPPPGGEFVLHGIPVRPGAGQLPLDNGRLPGAPDGLPGPRENRVVRLPAHHEGWNKETQGQ